MTMLKEANIKDALAGKCFRLQTNMKDLNESKLAEILKQH
jgi:hypothetical protein